MAGKVNELLRLYCPADKPMYLYASHRLVAEGWAISHGVDNWKYIGPKDVGKVKFKVKRPIVLLYDFDRKTIRKLQESGFDTYTPEGFHYRYNFS